jgi:hypothetical protein
MTVVGSAKPEQTAASFEQATGAVVGEMRSALAELVAALPGPVSRAVDLERQLEVDKKLAWRVFRLVNSSGLSEAAQVPGRPAVRRLLAAAESCGAPASVIGRIAAASERFERFASMHGETREEVISLMVRLAGAGGQAGDSYELKARKAFFRGAAHLWGVQARMQVRTMIHEVPEAIAEGTFAYRAVLVAGDIGMQRRDPTRPLVVSANLTARAGPGDEGDDGEHAAEGQPGGAELLPEYCSQPLPQMVPHPPGAAESGGGAGETELVFPVSGRVGAVTLYTVRTASAVDEPRASIRGIMFVAMPTEEIVFDTMVPVGHSDPASARVAIYGRRHHPERASALRTTDLFPQHEMVTYLGAQTDVPAVAGAPHHSDAVRDMIRRSGWEGRRFDVYRCRIVYPVLHTLIALQVQPVR